MSDKRAHSRTPTPTLIPLGQRNQSSNPDAKRPRVDPSNESVKITTSSSLPDAVLQLMIDIENLPEHPNSKTTNILDQILLYLKANLVKPCNPGVLIPLTLAIDKSPKLFQSARIFGHFIDMLRNIRTKQHAMIPFLCSAIYVIWQQDAWPASLAESVVEDWIGDRVWTEDDLSFTKLAFSFNGEGSVYSNETRSTLDLRWSQRLESMMEQKPINANDSLTQMKKAIKMSQTLLSLPMMKRTTGKYLAAWIDDVVPSVAKLGKSLFEEYCNSCSTEQDLDSIILVALMNGSTIEKLNPLWRHHMTRWTQNSSIFLAIMQIYVQQLASSFSPDLAHRFFLLCSQNPVLFGEQMAKALLSVHSDYLFDLIHSLCHQGMTNWFPVTIQILLEQKSYYSLVMELILLWLLSQKDWPLEKLLEINSIQYQLLQSNILSREQVQLLLLLTPPNSLLKRTVTSHMIDHFWRPLHKQFPLTESLLSISCTFVSLSDLERLTVRALFACHSFNDHRSLLMTDLNIIKHIQFMSRVPFESSAVVHDKQKYWQCQWILVCIASVNQYARSYLWQNSPNCRQLIEMLIQHKFESKANEEQMIVLEQSHGLDVNSFLETDAVRMPPDNLVRSVQRLSNSLPLSQWLSQDEQIMRELTENNVDWLLPCLEKDWILLKSVPTERFLSCLYCFWLRNPHYLFLPMGNSKSLLLVQELKSSFDDVFIDQSISLLKSRQLQQRLFIHSVLSLLSVENSAMFKQHLSLHFQDILAVEVNDNRRRFIYFLLGLEMPQLEQELNSKDEPITQEIMFQDVDVGLDENIHEWDVWDPLNEEYPICEDLAHISDYKPLNSSLTAMPLAISTLSAIEKRFENALVALFSMKDASAAYCILFRANQSLLLDRLDLLNSLLEEKRHSLSMDQLHSVILILYIAQLGFSQTMSNIVSIIISEVANLPTRAKGWFAFFALTLSFIRKLIEADARWRSFMQSMDFSIWCLSGKDALLLDSFVRHIQSGSNWSSPIDVNTASFERIKVHPFVQHWIPVSRKDESYLEPILKDFSRSCQLDDQIMTENLLERLIAWMRLDSAPLREQVFRILLRHVQRRLPGHDKIISSYVSLLRSSNQSLIEFPLSQLDVWFPFCFGAYGDIFVTLMQQDAVTVAQNIYKKLNYLSL